MGMMFSNPFKKKEVDYEELEGAAEEAGRAALKGEVGRASKAAGGQRDGGRQAKSRVGK